MGPAVAPPREPCANSPQPRGQGAINTSSAASNPKKLSTRAPSARGSEVYESTDYHDCSNPASCLLACLLACLHRTCHKTENRKFTAQLLPNSPASLPSSPPSFSSPCVPSVIHRSHVRASTQILFPLKPKPKPFSPFSFLHHFPSSNSPSFQIQSKSQIPAA